MPLEHQHRIHGTLKSLREECLRTLDEARAIEILTRSITPERVQHFDVRREDVRLCTGQRRLREWLTEWKQSVKRMRTQGPPIQATQSQLVRFFQICANLSSGEIVYVRKSELAQLLPHYDSTRLPYHARIGFDPHGFGSPANIVAMTLEGTLFEDMCALFNLARAYHDETVRTKLVPKKQLKTSFALYRAAISSAFFCGELCQRCGF